MDYDKLQYQASYDEARKLPKEAVDQWMRLLGEYLTPRDRLRILDLGSGTGRFSLPLAEYFDAMVVGVEPSEQMRAKACARPPHPRVTCVPGCAEAIPCEDESFDAAFLSVVLHHFRDIPAACAELARVLKPGGYVFLRSVFKDRRVHEGSYEAAFYRFFPSARTLDNDRFPAMEDVVTIFASAGLSFISHQEVTRAIDPGLKSFYERIRLRAISTFELMSEADIEQGLCAAKAAADAETDPQPVMDMLDFLTFQKAPALH